jgi:tRNA pseudouridine55 synthase
MLHVKKVGHTGTLDPIATGVLVLCLGWATRLSPFLSDLEKRYRARIHLGVCTDTLDAEGAITARSDRIPRDLESVSAVVQGFAGEIEQVPPMFSARKVSGKRLYQLARAGQEVHREARKVQVYRIEIECFDPPMLDVSVACSKGTYIRVLADDIGRELGCGGHIAALRRTAVGCIDLERCTVMEHLQSLQSEGEIEGQLVDPNCALGHMPGLRLDSAQLQRFSHGNPVIGIQAGEEAESECLVRALDLEGTFRGIGRWLADGAVLQPVRVFGTQGD